MAAAFPGADRPTVASITTKGIRSHRASQILAWLTALFRSCEWAGQPIDAVIYETPFARGRDATRCLWGIAGLIEAVATAAGAAVVDVQPSKIKAWATGSGKADKDAMTAAAKRMGYAGDNEHEADAYCLLKYGEENIRTKKAKP